MWYTINRRLHLFSLACTCSIRTRCNLLAALSRWRSYFRYAQRRWERLVGVSRKVSTLTKTRSETLLGASFRRLTESAEHHSHRVVLCMKRGVEAYARCTCILKKKRKKNGYISCEIIATCCCGWFNISNHYTQIIPEISVGICKEQFLNIIEAHRNIDDFKGERNARSLYF